MKSIRAFTPFTFLLLLLSVSAVVYAQVAECPALVEQALQAMGDNCGEMGRNSACYGFNQVDASFAADVDVTEDYFSQPADRADLVSLETIQTAPMNLDESLWGVAVMNVQANVPNTLPGQAVTFVLLGDSRVENRVDPADVTSETTPVEVTTNVRANVRSGAGTNFNLVGAVDPGTVFQADARSEDGNWVRVIYGERVAWISLEVINEAEGLDTLPVATDPVVTPMQAFYFSTGTGEPACNEAPDAIAIRAPQNFTVDLSINGANVRVGSLVTLKQISDSEFTLTVHEGHVETEDEDGDYDVDPNQTIVGLLDPDGDFTEWEDVRDATEEETARGTVAFDTMGALGLDVPLPDTNTGGGSCRGFQATSPLPPQGGLANGYNVFYWNAAPGATSYQVNVYNLSEPRGISFATAGAETSVGGNLTQETIGGGFDFAYEIQALRNGRVICTTPRIQLQRAAATVIGPSGPGMSATWYCSGFYAFSVQYANTPPGTTSVVIVFGFTGGAPTPGSGTTYGVPPDPATRNYTTFGPATMSGGSVIANPSGTIVPLPGAISC